MIRYDLILMFAFALVNASNHLTTTVEECNKCMETGVHCISANFMQTRCCDTSHGDLDSCMADYKYCTNNIAHAPIKQLTCPALSCSGKTRNIKIESVE